MVLTACAALALTSCGKTDRPAPTPDTPRQTAAASPSATADGDPRAAQKQELLTAYKSYWNEQAHAYAKADIGQSHLKRFASGEALSRAMVDVAAMKQAGTATLGVPGHDAKVTSLTRHGKLPAATVIDCLDISRWKTVKVSSGKPVALPKDQPLRYVTTVTAEQWGGQWMIIKVTPHGDRSC